MTPSVPFAERWKIIMDESKLTPEELEEMEKQFWEIVRKYRPEIFEENESDTE